MFKTSLLPPLDVGCLDQGTVLSGRRHCLVWTEEIFIVNMHCTLALESERAYKGFSFNEYPLSSHASDVPYVWELSSIGIGTMFHPYWN